MMENRNENTLFESIEAQCDALHFEKAEKLFDTNEESLHSDLWRMLLLQGRIHRGMYRFSESGDCYKEAYKHAKNEQERNQAIYGLVRCNLSLGHYVQAGNLLLKARPDRKDAQWYFLYALLLAELGKVPEAISKCDDYFKCPNCNKSSLWDVELALLRADLANYAGLYSYAQRDYDTALDYARHLDNGWKNLRIALILNNTADLYEEMELYDDAFVTYQQALDMLDSVDDPEIYDLDGARLEISLGLANLYSLMDEYEKCAEYCEKLMPLALHQKKAQQTYWKARILFLQGLCDFYQEKEDAFEKLYEAYRLFHKHLQQNKGGSLEYLGKAAFYSAYCCDPKDRELAIALYNKSLAIFEKLVYKDRHFYLQSIATIQNELGTLKKEENPERALYFYERSVETLLQLLQSYPHDSFAAVSLVAVCFNVLQLCENYRQDLINITIEQIERAVPLALQDDSSYVLGDCREKLWEAKLRQKLNEKQWNRLDALLEPAASAMFACGALQ
jgi:tetratricopeptide (TPR) repeat protein